MRANEFHPKIRPPTVEKGLRSGINAVPSSPYPFAFYDVRHNPHDDDSHEIHIHMLSDIWNETRIIVGKAGYTYGLGPFHGTSKADFW